MSYFQDPPVAQFGTDSEPFNKSDLGLSFALGRHCTTPRKRTPAMAAIPQQTPCVGALRRPIGRDHPSIMNGIPCKGIARPLRRLGNHHHPGQITRILIHIWHI